MLLLPATLTMPVARDTLRMLSQAFKQEPDTGIVVDASGLQQFDTAALAVLLECQRVAQAWGKGFAVRHAPPKLLALARLYGVDAVLSFEGAAAAP
ncbi:lipid asymmetry maintenance protein MlaB [Piscinibacter sp.]|jgi:phospholipid transport system transporter-binding protein|uniref:STAS domain-containing protein n=1 Tax=Piscinibacter sp. TaxID=1903157 RepID=UPI0035599864